MTHHEEYTPPHAEYLESAQNLDEVTAKYNELASTIALDHEARFTPIAATHEAAFADELRSPGSQDVDAVLHRTQYEVRASLEPAASSMWDVVQAAADIIPTMLSGSDQQVLAQAKDDIASFGVDSTYVERTLANASSGSTSDAMQAALDAEILNRLREDTHTYGVGSAYVTRTLQHASSPAVRAAMRASLDADVMSVVRDDVRTYGVGSAYVERSLRHASSMKVRAGMRTALDADVLVRARSDMRTYGVDSAYVTRTLQHSSSPTVGGVLRQKVSAGADTRATSAKRPASTRRTASSNLSGLDNGEQYYADASDGWTPSSRTAYDSGHSLDPDYAQNHDAIHSPSLRNRIGVWVAGLGVVAAAVGGMVHLSNQEAMQAERDLAERSAAFEPVLKPAAERIALDTIDNIATITAEDRSNGISGGSFPAYEDPDRLQLYFEVRQPDGDTYREEAIVGKDAAGNPDPTQVTNAEIRITGTETDTEPAIRNVIEISAQGEGAYNDPENAYWNLSNVFADYKGKTSPDDQGLSSYNTIVTGGAYGSNLADELETARDFVDERLDYYLEQVNKSAADK